jgi:hypothetical protein
MKLRRDVFMVVDRFSVCGDVVARSAALIERYALRRRRAWIAALPAHTFANRTRDRFYWRALFAFSFNVPVTSFIPAGAKPLRARAVNQARTHLQSRESPARRTGRGSIRRRTIMTEVEWMMAGMYMAALVCGTLFMSVLARRSLNRVEERGH